MDYIISNWLEVLGLISGILCVVLLIRQNVLTFPIGLVYSVVTVVVVGRESLYADVILNLYYVVMNAYGWYFWLYGGKARRQNDRLQIAQLSRSTSLSLVVVTIIGTLLMGWLLTSTTDADLAYPDSFTTVASFVAMWMAARKYLENWALWFVIDVVQVALYVIKGIELYALLYLLYLGLAIWGWRAWQKDASPSLAASA